MPTRGLAQARTAPVANGVCDTPPDCAVRSPTRLSANNRIGLLDRGAHEQTSAGVHTSMMVDSEIAMRHWSSSIAIRVSDSVSRARVPVALVPAKRYRSRNDDSELGEAAEFAMLLAFAVPRARIKHQPLQSPNNSVGPRTNLPSAVFGRLDALHQKWGNVLQWSIHRCGWGQSPRRNV